MVFKVYLLYPETFSIIAKRSRSRTVLNPFSRRLKTVRNTDVTFPMANRRTRASGTSLTSRSRVSLMQKIVYKRARQSRRNPMPKIVKNPPVVKFTANISPMFQKAVPFEHTIKMLKLLKQFSFNVHIRKDI